MKKIRGFTQGKCLVKSPMSNVKGFSYIPLKTDVIFKITIEFVIYRLILTFDLIVILKVTSFLKNKSLAYSITRLLGANL